jgi:hypothetical protein
MNEENKIENQIEYSGERAFFSFNGIITSIDNGEKVNDFQTSGNGAILSFNLVNTFYFFWYLFIIK